jgi:hypothetical protein
MLQDKLKEHLLAKNKQKELEHTRSGYLSASRLWKSTLENCLSLLDVKGLEIDAYALGVFARGNQVEDWIVEQFNEMGLLERYQTEVAYITPDGYKVVGIEDCKFKGEDMPTEIKSIKNSQFKYLDLEGAKMAHKLQACVYALAGGYEKFRVLYVSAEDFRIKEFILFTKDYKDKVVELVRDVYDALNKKRLPEFEPLDDFMASKKYTEYTAYPNWFGAYKEKEVKVERTGTTGKKYTRTYKQEVLDRTHDSDILMEALKRQHPEAYSKLMEDRKWGK